MQQVINSTKFVFAFGFILLLFGHSTSFETAEQVQICAGSETLETCSWHHKSTARCYAKAKQIRRDDCPASDNYRYKYSYPKAGGRSNCDFDRNKCHQEPSSHIERCDLRYQSQVDYYNVLLRTSLIIHKTPVQLSKLREQCQYLFRNNPIGGQIFTQSKTVLKNARCQKFGGNNQCQLMTNRIGTAVTTNRAVCGSADSCTEERNLGDFNQCKYYLAAEYAYFPCIFTKDPNVDGKISPRDVDFSPKCEPDWISTQLSSDGENVDCWWNCLVTRQEERDAEGNVIVSKQYGNAYGFCPNTCGDGLCCNSINKYEPYGGCFRQDNIDSSSKCTAQHYSGLSGCTNSLEEEYEKANNFVDMTIGCLDGRYPRISNVWALSYDVCTPISSVLSSALFGIDFKDIEQFLFQIPINFQAQFYYDSLCSSSKTVDTEEMNNIRSYLVPFGNTGGFFRFWEIVPGTNNHAKKKCALTEFARQLYLFYNCVPALSHQYQLVQTHTACDGSDTYYYSEEKICELEKNRALRFDQEEGQFECVQCSDNYGAVRYDDMNSVEVRERHGILNCIYGEYNRNACCQCKKSFFLNSNYFAVAGDLRCLPVDVREVRLVLYSDGLEETRALFRNNIVSDYFKHNQGQMKVREGYFLNFENYLETQCKQYEDDDYQYAAYCGQVEGTQNFVILELDCPDGDSSVVTYFNENTAPGHECGQTLKKPTAYDLIPVYTDEQFLITEEQFKSGILVPIRREGVATACLRCDDGQYNAYCQKNAAGQFLPVPGECKECKYTVQERNKWLSHEADGGCFTWWIQDDAFIPVTSDYEEENCQMIVRNRNSNDNFLCLGCGNAASTTLSYQRYRIYDTTNQFNYNEANIDGVLVRQLNFVNYDVQVHTQEKSPTNTLYKNCVEILPYCSIGWFSEHAEEQNCFPNNHQWLIASMVGESGNVWQNWRSDCCSECESCGIATLSRKSQDWQRCSGATNVDTQICTESCDVGQYQTEDEDGLVCKKCTVC